SHRPTASIPGSPPPGWRSSIPSGMCRATIATTCCARIDSTSARRWAPMATDTDRYEAWYSYKLWTLLPALYRAEDSDSLDQPGHLQELVARIGAQAAIVRRSIDRLWDDQSIETCDDWVIDYIGDLLATNLVASLDERGRRVDVGKTINYRRRKGTLALA